MKGVLRRAVLTLLVTLVVLELGLQLVSILAPKVLTRSTGAAASNAITMLCVGDSHTYGAPLPEEEAYPAQLQKLLEERYLGWEFNVVNLGFPGVNSAFVANRLERQILQLRPDLVMVSAGANNVWNTLETESGGAGSRLSALRLALLRVKLFRLMAVAWSAGSKDGFGFEEDGKSRWRHPDQEAVRSELNRELRESFAEARAAPEQDWSKDIGTDSLARWIASDMTRIVETTRAYDTPIIWFNYPWRRQKIVLETIDATGERLGIPVVRGADDFARATADGHSFTDLFVWGAGPHPNGLMYRYIVESMVPYVAAALKNGHGIDLSSPPSGDRASR